MLECVVRVCFGCLPVFACLLAYVADESSHSHGVVTMVYHGGGKYFFFFPSSSSAPSFFSFLRGCTVVSIWGVF